MPNEFKCIGAYNPSGIFPSILIPVFEKVSESDERPFHQLFSSTGEILGFEPILGATSFSLSKILDFADRSNRPYEIGDQRCIAYASSPEKYHFAHFSEISDENLIDLLSDVSLFRNPLSATVMIRQVLNGATSELDQKKHLYSPRVGQLVAARFALESFSRIVSNVSKPSNQYDRIGDLFQHRLESDISEYVASEHGLGDFSARLAFLLPLKDSVEFREKLWKKIAEHWPDDTVIPLMPRLPLNKDTVRGFSNLTRFIRINGYTPSAMAMIHYDSAKLKETGDNGKFYHHREIQKSVLNDFLRRGDFPRDYEMDLYFNLHSQFKKDLVFFGLCDRRIHQFEIFHLFDDLLEDGFFNLKYDASHRSIQVG